MAESMDCDAETVVDNLLLQQRVVRRGWHVHFPIPRWKFDPIGCCTIPIRNSNMRSMRDKGKASCSNLQQSCSKVVAGVSTYNCRGRENKQAASVSFFFHNSLYLRVAINGDLPIPTPEIQRVKKKRVFSVEVRCPHTRSFI